MRYQGALIAVSDVKKSLAFYQKWFALEVEVDLGWNVGLKGGLSPSGALRGTAEPAGGERRPAVA